MAKILLVEDDTNLSEIYQARMEAEGYTVVAASDGESALAVAAKERPDLIISDVMMPKISGFEMLDILRNTAGLQDTPVIMLTALGQADDRSRADQLGANKYLVKSQVTLEDIVNAAHNLLGDGDDSGSGAPLQAPASQQPSASQDDGTAASDDQAAVPAAAAPTGPREPTGPATPPPAAEPKSQPKPAPAPEPAVAEKPAEAEKVPPANYERRPVAPVGRPQTPPPVDRSQAAAPTPAPAAPASATSIDDKIVASTVDRLLQKTPQGTAPAAPAPAPVVNPAIPAPASAVSGDAATTDTPASEPASAGERAAKKVISPIERPGQPTLHELLAKEEALNPPAAALPNDSDEQTPPANDKKPPIDPNSIAL